MSDAESCRVLVLRPMPGNAATVARLATKGLVALSVPLFAVEPVEWAAPNATGFDALVLTSANAVRHAGKELAMLTHLPLWCVGEATASVARAAGLTVDRVGAAGVAELLSDTTGYLLWLCGEQRSRLAEQDERRVTAVPVYRTVDLPVPASAFERPAIAMLHSARAAHRFAALVGERSRIAIVAISPAVAAAAGAGWSSVAVAALPDDDAMVEIAVKLCQTGCHDGNQAEL